MSQSNNQTSVAGLYHAVIEDVIAGVRDAFLDEGIDEQVLQELKVMWENKLAASKALEKPTSSQTSAAAAATTTTAAVHNNDQVQAGSQGSAGQRVPVVAAENGASSQPTPSLFPAIHQPNVMVPIQIKIPEQNRCVTIQVPFAAVQSNKLQDVLTPAVLDATMSLPEELVATNLQEKVLAALNYGAGANPQSSVITQAAAKQTSVIMSQKLKPLNPSVHFDGGVDDSSDEEEEEEDDDDDIDDDIDDKDEEVEEEQEGEGQDEEPLNSDDDVSDNEDSNDKLYDIDNVVVCQYDKITRSRNKWKFHLKDGVMNLNGTDYVFQKATGDAEW